MQDRVGGGAVAGPEIEAQDGPSNDVRGVHGGAVMGPLVA